MLELIQKIKDYTEAGIILEHMELFEEPMSNESLHMPYTLEELAKLGIYKCDIGGTCYIDGYGCVRRSHKEIEHIFSEDAHIFVYDCYADLSLKVDVVEGRRIVRHVCEHENLVLCATEMKKVFDKEGD